MTVEREIKALFGELQILAQGLKGFGEIEAAMRLRALAELADSLGTEALLGLAATHAPPPPPKVTRLRRAA